MSQNQDIIFPWVGIFKGGTMDVKYPHSVQCRNNIMIEIKLLTADTIPKLIEMYRALSEGERAMLRRNVLDPKFAEQVRRDLEDEFVHRLTAWVGDIVVGSISLHRGYARWMNHTAEARIVTHPKYRRYGIATVLFDEIIPFARTHNIEKVYANLLPSQQAAINLIKNIGFRREATLKHHVKDIYDRYHDMRIYSVDLEAAHKAMEELLVGFSGYAE